MQNVIILRLLTVCSRDFTVLVGTAQLWHSSAFSDASGRFDFNYGLAVQALTHCRASCRRRARRDQQEGTMTPEQSL